jgi:hypothetical protein
MEYLNRANNTLSGINRTYGEASNMMNTLRQPVGVSQTMVRPHEAGNQFYYPFNQNTKENFYDTMESCDWWIILVLLLVLFIVLYLLNNKKQLESLLLI